MLFDTTAGWFRETEVTEGDVQPPMTNISSWKFHLCPKHVGKPRVREDQDHEAGDGVNNSFQSGWHFAPYVPLSTWNTEETNGMTGLSDVRFRSIEAAAD